MKRTIPLIITFAAGLVIILSMFMPPLSHVGEDVSEFFNIVACFAYILGGANLLKMHSDRVYMQRSGWGYSLITVLAFLVTLVIGLFKIGTKGGWSADISSDGPFSTIYDALYAPLASTMFALLGFYVASAAFRAFRAKNREAAILLGAAVIVLLGRTFIGGMLTSFLPEQLSFLHIPNLVNWVMAVPSLAGQRAIMIGIALGVIATSLKIIIGIERSHLGSNE